MRREKGGREGRRYEEGRKERREGGMMGLHSFHSKLFQGSKTIIKYKRASYRTIRKVSAPIGAHASVTSRTFTKS